MDITLASSASPKTVNTVGNDQMVQLEYDGYTISWDMINTQQNSNHISASSTVQLVTKDSAEDVNFTLGGEKLTEKASACLDKLNSSVVYDSIFEDVDVSLDILPSSIKETIILNDKDSVPEQFAYYITADGLDAELQADNSIEFTNEQDEVIFTMPAMFMFDSSSAVPEYNYDIETAITPIKNGYLLTITPDSDWLNSEDRVYPVMIDPEFVPTITTLTDSYITEEDPDLCARNLMLKMGGSKTDGTRCESFLSFNPSDILVTADEILDATCTMFFVPDTEQESYPMIAVSLLQESVSQPTWNTANYNQVDSANYYTYPTSINFAMYQDLDITGLVQTWQNYVKTNGLVGSPNYGFKLLASIPTGDYSSISAYSSRYFWPPSFEITYRTQTPYKLYYSPDKYNDVIDGTTTLVDNFQHRMNCYSYALQSYYAGDLVSVGVSTIPCYNLKAGEIGIGQQLDAVDEYNIETYSDLLNYYDVYATNIYSIIDEVTSELYANPDQYLWSVSDEVIATTEFQTQIADFTDFIETQMYKDAKAMNFNITILGQGKTFSRPSDLYETGERIIAMITYYAGSSTIEKGVCDHHFYLRNGDGTCTAADHAAECSIWTHKQSSDKVKNYPGSSSSITLCDQNIGVKAYLLGNGYTNLYNEANVNYYAITKDTNIYNSWYGNGHYDESTGTPYLSLT